MVKQFITNVLGPVAFVVQVMLLIDLGSDLYAKYKAKNAAAINLNFIMNDVNPIKQGKISEKAIPESPACPIGSLLHPSPMKNRLQVPASSKNSE